MHCHQLQMQLAINTSAQRHPHSHKDTHTQMCTCLCVDIDVLQLELLWLLLCLLWRISLCISFHPCVCSFVLFCGSFIFLKHKINARCRNFAFSLHIVNKLRRWHVHASCSDCSPPSPPLPASYSRLLLALPRLARQLVAACRN